MIYFCCDERRRDAVRGRPDLNGIDFVEVDDDPNDADDVRQRRLRLYLINPLAPANALGAKNLRIEGGERIRDIEVTAAVGPPISPPSPPEEGSNLLTLKLNAPGDFSTYTLRLVAGQDLAAPAGFDPQLSAVRFSFKVNCVSDFDCLPEEGCPPSVRPLPDIDYLAKDYAGFRRLMLDRMATLVPTRKEHSPADLGVALVELLAYVGDHLSYQQDAVATEAYLTTARRRSSVRRHARLVDYPMHDGANARAWVQVRARPGAADFLLAARAGPELRSTQVLTRPDDADASGSGGASAPGQPVVFELMHDLVVREAHNEVHFHTWGERECCIPKGATRATLRGAVPHLEGSVLVLAEVRGPATGQPADADPTRRHAVRVIRASPAQDPLGEPFASPPTPPIDVTEIAWHADDALPLPLCLSSRRGTTYFDRLSVAWGNIVLADHGRTLKGPEELGRVPARNPALVTLTAKRCEAPTPIEPPLRFRPRLHGAPLTQAVPLGRSASGAELQLPASARAALEVHARDAIPAIELAEIWDGTGEAPAWRPRRDLLNSGATAKEFVVEVEADGSTHLRFGDGRYGERPSPGVTFSARYRVGNGRRGNVGAGVLTELRSCDPAASAQVFEVWNPLPARGGVDPESMERVRQDAPHTFRRQERAVTPKDYAERAKACDATVQRAEATLRWTGSWHTVYATVDRLAAAPVDAAFEAGLRGCLEKYRMAGHDLEVDGPRYVALDVAMTVCVERGYSASAVRAALLEVFSRGTLRSGRRGVFHPDNFTFGQTVYLSTLYAEAQAIAGVDSVEVTTFQRRDAPGGSALDEGLVAFGRLEIPCLDNDPNHPERGVFGLTLEGGN